MRRYTAYKVIILSLWAVLGQSEAARSQTAPVFPKPVLEMQILRSDGTPVSYDKIDISFTSPHFVGNYYGAKTGADGMIRLNGEWKGHFVFHLYSPQNGSLFIPDFDADSYVGPLKVRLKKNRSSIYVTTREVLSKERKQGKLLGSMRVQFYRLFSYVPKQLPRYILAFNGSTRDGDGTVRINNLEPGRYVAVCSGEDFEADAKIVDVSGKDVIQLDMRLARWSTAELQLTLVDSRNQPFKNTEFLAQLTEVTREGTNEMKGENITSEGEALNYILVNQRWFAVWGQRSWNNNVQRKIRTNEKGQVTLYPMNTGKWRVQLFHPEDTAYPKAQPALSNAQEIELYSESKGTVTLQSKN